MWTWFATAWTLGLLAIPVLLLPAALGLRDHPAMHILATAVSGFPVWDLAGLLGSTGWGLWVAALGVCILIRSARGRTPARAGAPADGLV